ncbi:MAG: oligosaccharide flippase family protein [Chloroflexi bacterium]|nr:oligosaccharide flippase family protein [Chloroflexota bacterium]
MRRDLPIIALLFFLPLILFWPQTGGGMTLLPAENLYQWEPFYTYRDEAGAPDLPHNHLLSDLVLQNMQWKTFTREQFADGEIPLWNPYQFAGVPFLAAGQQQVLYPLGVLYLILPLAAAYGWFTVIHLWLAGVFMFWFVRALGTSRFAAVLAAITYQLCAMLVTSAVFPMIIGAAIWLPLILLAVEYIIRGRTLAGRTASPLWAAVGALAVGCSVLSGHAELTIYTLLIAGYFAGARLLGLLLTRQPSRPILGKAGWLLGMVAVGLLLSAVQLVPLVEFVQTNWRAERSSFEQVLSYAHPARDLIQFILPNFYGSPAHHAYFDLFGGEWQPALTQPDGLRVIDWGIKNYVESALYLGILPLAVAAFALLAPRQSERPPYRLIFVVLGAASLTFMFGLPTYAAVYALPGINQLNTPFRWIYGLTVAVAILAALGADAVAKNRALARYFGWALIGTGGTMTVGLIAARVTFDLWAPVLEPIIMGMEKASGAFSDMAMFFSYQAPNVLILAAATAGSGWVLLRLFGDIDRVRPVTVGAIALLAADLMLASWGFNAASDPALLEYRPPALQVLIEQGNDGRYLVLNRDGQRDILQANMTLRDRLGDVRGYDSIISSQFVAYMREAYPQSQLDFNRISALYGWMDVPAVLGSARFQLLGVRHIVTHLDTELDVAGWVEVYSDRAVRIYENEQVLPLAAVLPPDVVARPLDQPLEPAMFIDNAAQLVSDTGRERVYTINPTGESILFVSETYAPGWKAFVRAAGAPETDEREVPVERVFENFIGVALNDQSPVDVRLIYSPSSFQIGAFGSVIGVALTVLMGGVWAWRALFDRRPDAGGTRLMRNTVAPIMLNLFNRGIDFAFASVMFRILGPERAGEYYYAIVIFGWFDIFTNFGLDVYLIREAGRLREQAAALFSGTTLFRLILAGAAIPLLLAFLLIRQALADPLSGAVLLTIALFYVGLIPGSFSKGLTSLYYAFDRAEYPAMVTSLTTISKVTGGVIALMLGWGIVGLAAVSIVTNVITLGVLLWGARDILRTTRGAKPNLTAVRSMAGQSWPLMLNHFLATVFFQIDIVILEAMKGERVVGLYRVAYSWLLAINVVPAFYTQALMATMSRQAADDRAALRTTYRMSIKLLVGIALPLAVTFTILAEPLTWLLGGSAYLPDGQIALQIMIWSIPIGWMNSLTQYALVALDLQRRVTRAFAAACAFNIVTNLILIPTYSYQAAAFTTIASELVLCLYFARLMHVGVGAVGWVGMLWKLYAAAGTMLMVTLVASAIAPNLAAVMVGGVAYLAVFVLLRPFEADELARLGPMLPRRAMRLLGGAAV